MFKKEYTFPIFAEIKFNKSKKPWYREAAAEISLKTSHPGIGYLYLAWQIFLTGIKKILHLES